MYKYANKCKYLHPAIIIILHFLALFVTVFLDLAVFLKHINFRLFVFDVFLRLLEHLDVIVPYPISA